MERKVEFADKECVCWWWRGVGTFQCCQQKKWKPLLSTSAWQGEESLLCSTEPDSDACATEPPANDSAR
eukprot:35496-Chlamydomonas_euryale.AAC.1